jgi:hypothetical protein
MIREYELRGGVADIDRVPCEAVVAERLAEIHGLSNRHLAAARRVTA